MSYINLIFKALNDSWISKHFGTLTAHRSKWPLFIFLSSNEISLAACASRCYFWEECQYFIYKSNLCYFGKCSTTASVLNDQTEEALIHLKLDESDYQGCTKDFKETYEFNDDWKTCIFHTQSLNGPEQCSLMCIMYQNQSCHFYAYFADRCFLGNFDFRGGTFPDGVSVSDNTHVFEQDGSNGISLKQITQDYSLKVYLFEYLSLLYFNIFQFFF